MHAARTEVDLLIVGGGPTGLTAAITAHSHGLSVEVIDSNTERTPYSKALVLHSRSLEVFDDLGCAEALVAAGRPFRALHVQTGREELACIEFARLDWGGAPFPMWLTLPQSSTERCLEEHLEHLGTRVRRGTTARAVVDRGDHVEVESVGPDGAIERRRAAWVLGADGARSRVRAATGIPLDGEVTPELFVLADVDMQSKLADAEGYNVVSPHGVLLVVPMDVPGKVRLIAHLPGLRPEALPTLDAQFFQRILDERLPGAAATITALGWTSSFTPKQLLARRYRSGRVFLAGDAAHLHSPVGGQGLNTGIQDAYDLVWRIALARRGHASPGLLDTYERERGCAVAGTMIRDVARATRALTLEHPVARTIRNRVGRALLSLPAVRDRLGASVGMLRLRYPRSCAIAATRTLGLRGPRPGERVPLSIDHPALSNALRGRAHVLIVFTGEDVADGRRAATTLYRALPAVAREHTASVVVSREPGELEVGDPDGALHDRFGVSAATVFWARPDRCVGYRGAASDVRGLTDYCEGVFGGDGSAP
ncbi:MAG: FAD-dependent monooxygenase [Polyangiaceae bacterium]